MRPARLSTVLLVLFVVADVAFGRSPASSYLKRPDSWFASAEAARIAANILSYQSDLGGWPKNTDTASSPYSGKDREKDLKPTFDNGATTDELRFLARIHQATKAQKDVGAASAAARYPQAFVKGLDYILKAQYPTGGWPQFYPPSTQYHRHITFNDDAMVRLLQFLREVDSQERYTFVDEPRKQAARSAFDRGIQCILKCQIKVDGKLTAWCAQHDEKDYTPRPGRTYELISISGAESVNIVRLLMSLDNPSPQVIAAVQGAAEWFESAKLKGIKVVIVEDKNSPKGTDKRVLPDASAAPMWARFHEIGTNRPIFCDRDGVAKHNLAEIGYERRNGYSWLGYYAQELLAKEYPAWKAKWGQ